MSKVKQETVKDAIDRLVNVEVPRLVEQVMGNVKMSVEERVTQVGLLDTVIHHLKLIQARLE